MKPKHIKKVLMSEINKVANNPKDYCFHPDTDFTRKRKIPMKAVLTGIIGMGSGSLTNELTDFFHASPQMPTPSAFLQQRSKIKPEAFRSIFDGFNETITKGFSEKMPIFAVDGSDIQIIIAKNVIPIRPDRHGERKATTKIFHGFLYRVA